MNLDDSKVNIQVIKNNKITLDETFSWDDFCQTFNQFYIEQFKNHTCKITIESMDSTKIFFLIGQ
jgi:hypothetical protein